MLIFVYLTSTPSLSLTAPTDGVKNLTVTSQSATQLQLSWQPPTTSACITTKYLVQYTVVNQDQCAELNVGPLDYAEVYQTMVVLSGVLVPHSTYTVFVSPMNDAGLGPVSEITVVTSDQGKSLLVARPVARGGAGGATQHPISSKRSTSSHKKGPKMGLS